MNRNSAYAMDREFRPGPSCDPVAVQSAFGDVAADEGRMVHIVDDDASIRRTLEKLFASVGIRAVSYDTAQAFLNSGAVACTGECLILDVRMPGLSGLDLQDRLASSEKSLPVVMMTGHADVPMSVRAMKAGAVDFLSKPFREQEMLEAVMSALDTDRRHRVLTDEAQRLADLFATLSPRERQVMGMVTAGRLNKQVAGDLDLSMITVKIHRKSAMRKMQARTLADLVRMAAVLGLHQDEASAMVRVEPTDATRASLALQAARRPRATLSARRA